MYIMVRDNGGNMNSFNKNKLITACHSGNMLKQFRDDKRKAAFTLAEALFALAIIGIVAALTIPQLVANYQKHVASTRVKKAYTELQLAIQRSEVDNGNMADWTYPTKVNVANTRAFVNKYIKPYYLDLSECSTGNSRNVCGAPVSRYGVNYRTKNGTGISFLAGDSSNPNNSKLKGFHAYIDINGSKGPNIGGYDVFYFTTINDRNLLKPANWTENITARQLLSNGARDYAGRANYCKKEKSNSSDVYYRHACTLLLYLKNWKMDAEYPW